MVLNEVQLKCLELLTQGVKKTKIAKDLQINRREIYRWLEEEEFKKTFDKMTQNYLTIAQANAKRLAPLAVETIEKLLKSKNERVRLDAAREVLDRGLGKASTKIEMTVEPKNNEEEKKEKFRKMLEEDNPIDVEATIIQG